MINLPGGFLDPLCAKQRRNRGWFSLRCIFPGVWPLQAQNTWRSEWSEAVRSARLGAQPSPSWCCALAYLTAAQRLYPRASPVGGTFRTVNSQNPEPIPSKAHRQFLHLVFRMHWLKRGQTAAIMYYGIFKIDTRTCAMVYYDILPVFCGTSYAGLEYFLELFRLAQEQVEFVWISQQLKNVPQS